MKYGRVLLWSSFTSRCSVLMPRRLPAIFRMRLDLIREALAGLVHGTVVHSVVQCHSLVLEPKKAVAILRLSS